MRILRIPKEELDAIPKGDPIPSIVPQEGYGNHSCNDCLNQRCPITNYIAIKYGGSDKPNSCSFYWPPNTPDYVPRHDYHGELQQIAKEIAEAQE